MQRREGGKLQIPPRELHLRQVVAFDWPLTMMVTTAKIALL
jgi:hypothetical protein